MKIANVLDRTTSSKYYYIIKVYNIYLVYNLACHKILFLKGRSTWGSEMKAFGCSNQMTQHARITWPCTERVAKFDVTDAHCILH